MVMERFRLFFKAKEVFYYIGNHGTVKSLRINNMAIHTLTPSITKSDKWDKQGYLKVIIMVDGKYKNFPIHRMVAETFCDKRGCRKNLEVNHRDGNKHNNISTNLEWVVRKYNVLEAYRLGLIKKADVKGPKNPNYGKTKYPIETVLFAMALIKKGTPLSIVSKSVGINAKTLWCYKRNLKKFPNWPLI